MQTIPRTTAVHRYHPILVFLHWGLAAFIAAALILGALEMAPMSNTNPMKAEALRAHMTGGLLILMLMLLRFVIRQATPHPPVASTGSNVLDVVARISHRVLYALVIAMALSGLLMAVQTGIIPLLVGRHASIPPDFWVFPIRGVHYLISRLLIALITLHLVGALFHALILKDGLFGRMAFGRRISTAGTPIAERQWTLTDRLPAHFGRSVLLLQSVVLTLIALRVLVDPIGASAKDQIGLGSPLAIVVTQIGFGAFPLAAAIFVVICTLSAATVRAGLVFVLIFDLTALGIRLHGVLSVGGFAENRGPFIGETVFGVLALTALVWQSRGPRRSTESLASVIS
jgi:cytochrome b561